MTQQESERRARALAEFHRELEIRQRSYRGRALNMFPHICARCGREFSGKRMRELTVHHKDLNHDNNPPDGSNWELLCLYCHDDQHGVASQKAVGDRPMPVSGRDPAPIANPFERLGELLGKKQEPSDSQA